MNDINVSELRLLHTSLQDAGEYNISFDDFVQDRINTFKNDWYMYRPIVEKLERDVRFLLDRVQILESNE